MSFQLKTSYFEGPLELLLSLIEEKKLHISEISLAQVTEDYLNYINAISESSKTLLDRSQFVVVAATLILIKARSLVPTIELSQEETESIDDLTERLRLYEIVKRYGELFAKQFSKKPSMYRGNPPREKKVPVFTPHESLTIELIVATLHEVCAALPVVQSLPEKSVKVTITLADVMDRVQKAISSGTWLASPIRATRGAAGPAGRITTSCGSNTSAPCSPTRAARLPTWKLSPAAGWASIRSKR
jgi:segregation and condensation protein A